MRFLERLFGPTQPSIPLPAPPTLPTGLDPAEKRELDAARRRLEGPDGRLAALDELIEDYRRFEELLDR